MLDANCYPVGWLQVMGRLKHSVSARQAMVRLKVLAPQIYRATLDQAGLDREDGRPARPEDRAEYGVVPSTSSRLRTGSLTFAANINTF